MNAKIALRITAIPSLTDSTNFDLDSPVGNRRMLKSIRGKEVTERYSAPSEDYEFFRTGGWETGGYIVMVNLKRSLICYLVKYERPEKVEGAFRPVVQTCVWRAIEWATNHLASKVFFDFLLHNCGCIMSDKIQTPEGRRFWENMLSTADHLGYVVSFVYKNRVVSTYDGQTDLQDWVASFNTWGEGQKYQLDRFLISKE